MQEELGFPHKIKVLISKDLGKQDIVIGLEDLKNLGILHQDFPKTLPEKRREQVNMQYNSIRGDQWSEQMQKKERMEGRDPEDGVQWSQQEEVKEEREERARTRGVLLYLEERYEQVDEKISNFDTFPEEIKVVLDKYIKVFDRRLWKSMNVEPVQLNLREGSRPYACYSCRPTPAHYRAVA